MPVAHLLHRVGGEDPYGARPLGLEQLVYGQILGLGAFGAVLGALALRRRAWPAPGWTVHVWNLGGVLLVTLVLYDALSLRGMRVLSGHLLFSLVLLAGTARTLGRLAIAGVVVSGLLTFGTFRAMFIDVHRDHFPEARPEIDAARTAFGAAGVRYADGADRWCNTMLWLAPYNRDALAVPRGIGVNFALAPTSLDRPPRSRWILLAPAAEEVDIVDQWELRDPQPVGQLGTLYRNGAARC